MFDVAEVAKWLACDVEIARKICGFRQDSREVVPGDLFFALKGEKSDGHQHLAEVAAQGAVGAVVSKSYAGEAFGLALLRVEDVMTSLHQLAKIVHSARKMRVVGVTGSVGKTTTKEFIATLLEGKYRVAKTLGNANSQVGIPLTILNLKEESDVFVVEMGMSLPHEMQKLVAIAPPEVALITKIALAHAASFPDGLEGIAAAKTEILSHALTRFGILNHQVAQFSSAKRGNCAKLSYGIGGDCDFLLCKSGAYYYVQEKGERSPEFALPFSASHLAENFVGAVAVARTMGMQWPEILPQIPKLIPFKGRFERVERQGIIFINDSYNANPTSTHAALENLPLGKKRIAVLGAMKELGVFSEESHRRVAQIALGAVDHLLCFGAECEAMIPIFKAGNKPVEHFQELADLKRRVFELAQEGDVVLLKGSNSSKLWLILSE